MRKQNSKRHKGVQLWAKSVKDLEVFGRISNTRHPRKSSQHVRACATGDGTIFREKLSRIMGTAPILEMCLRSPSVIMAPEGDR